MIAVMFSGGVDSTLALLYAIKENPSTPIVAVSVSDTQYLPYATNLLKFFPEVSFETVDNDRTDGVIKHAIGKVLADPRFDKVYTGITQNPKVTIQGKEPLRITPEAAALIPKLVTPFVSWTKDKVVREFFALGKQALLPYTRSCTESPAGKPPCGKCWQCGERDWAFKTVGIDDEVKFLVGEIKDLITKEIVC
jgi:Queuosine biosynthesis protein QueC